MSNYDYVIAGPGSADCVPAARLSEDLGVRVALVEAGDPDTAQEIHIPAALTCQVGGDVWEARTPAIVWPKSSRTHVAGARRRDT